MAENVSHQGIEDAFRAPAKVLETLPDCIESRESIRLIGVAEDLAHVARENYRAEEEPAP